MIRPKIALSTEVYELIKDDARLKNVPISKYLAELIVSRYLTTYNAVEGALSPLTHSTP